jgi:hypothetical protein
LNPYKRHFKNIFIQLNLPFKTFLGHGKLMKSKILFCSLALLTLLNVATQAFASDRDASLYVVENIKTDVTADNAVKAREQALAKARKKAFNVLSERVLDDAAQNKVKDIDDITISSLINNLEITNEKLSSVRYIASVNVTFNKDAINSYFYNTGESYTTAVKRPFLVLPWYLRGRMASLWQDNNPWSISWQTVAHSGQNITPFMLPMGDIMDIRDYSVNSPYIYQGEQLENLKARYDVDEVILAIAEEQQGQLVIQLYETSMGTPSLLHSFAAQRSAHDNTVYRRGVEQALAFLNSNWKAQTAISSQQPAQAINVIARYSGLNGWITLRDLLKDVHGIESTDIKSVSPQKADITINYRGDIQNLALKLDQYNIALIQTPIQRPQNYAYNNTYMQNSAYAPQMQYEIFLKQNR